MKNLSIVVYIVMFMAGSLAMSACSKKEKQAEKSEQPAEQMHEKHEHESGHAHEQPASEEGHHAHGHGEGTQTGSGEINWTPSGNGEELIRLDFHFIAGKMENIKPKVTKAEDGSQVLELTADGKPVAFVFHSQYGNIGMQAAINRMDFKGDIKLIHHANSLENYEFVSVNGTDMKLGRYENGKERILDQGSFEAKSGWMKLKATAAGTHFKGYVDNKMVTHGHADVMENGFIGIMLNGTGKVQIKSIEAVELEDE